MPGEQPPSAGRGAAFSYSSSVSKQQAAPGITQRSATPRYASARKEALDKSITPGHFREPPAAYS